MGKKAMKSMKASKASASKPMKSMKAAPKKSMKKKGQAGKSDQKELDIKIEAFLKEASAVQSSSTGELDVMKLPWKKYFDASQMSALWNRLHNKIQTQASAETKSSWNSISVLSTREGKGNKKRNVLWLSLKFPDDWANRTVRYVQSVVKSESVSTSETPKTRGELNQTHGETEATDLINKGFFEEIKVKGVPHYVKVNFNRTNSLTRQTKEDLELQKTVGQDEIKHLEEKFDQYRASLDLEWAVVQAKDRAQETLSKLQEVSTASLKICNQFSGNKYAKAVITDLKKGGPILDKCRKKITLAISASKTDPQEVKKSCQAAVESMENQLGHIKTGQRLL